eukprot:5140572-Prymnesium_polylepis.1
MPPRRLQPFNNLKLDPWTLVAEKGHLRTSSHKEDEAKPVAQGDLLLWHPTSLRFLRVECTIAEDLDGLWCLWGGPTVRVPLARIKRVRVTRAALGQFVIDCFPNGRVKLRARADELQPWVTVLRNLCRHACAVTAPAAWSAEWAAVRIQSRAR